MKIVQPLLNKSSSLMKSLAGQFNPSGLGLSLSVFKKHSDGRSAASAQEEEHPEESALRSTEYAVEKNEKLKEKAKKDDKKRVAALIGAGIIPNSTQQANASFRARVESQTNANTSLKGTGTATKTSQKDQDWEHKVANSHSNPSAGLTT